MKGSAVLNLSTATPDVVCKNRGWPRRLVMRSLLRHVSALNPGFK